MNKIIIFFRESVVEMKKVIWPSRQEAINHTILVIGVSLGVALFIGAVDYALTYGIEYIIK